MDGVFNPVEKTDSELSRLSSFSLLCGRTEEREGDEYRLYSKGVELRETIQWIFEALKLLKESEKLEKNFLRVRTAE